MTTGRAEKSRPAAGMALVTALLGAAVATLMASTARATFSESETLGPNTVTAGVVDLEVGDSSAPFRVENLTPGDRAQAQITLRNAGTLPLNLSVVFESDGGSLGNRLATAVTAETCAETSTAAVGIALNQLSADPALTDLGIAAGGDATICIDLLLPIDASNEVQGTSVSFQLRFLAEQAVGLPEPTEDQP